MSREGFGGGAVLGGQGSGPHLREAGMGEEVRAREDSRLQDMRMGEERSKISERRMKKEKVFLSTGRCGGRRDPTRHFIRDILGQVGLHHTTHNHKTLCFGMPNRTHCFWSP